jgi:hypothetical protein
MRLKKRGEGAAQSAARSGDPVIGKSGDRKSAAPVNLGSAWDDFG